jgi:ferredoxin-NADP reductase
MPQKLPCEVLNIIDHGERVYSVFLKPTSPFPSFKAGQFLHLALDQYNFGDFWPESRAFSIASSPTEHNLLRITYAVKGCFTKRMEAELDLGRKVWIKLPYGDFIVNPEGDACLLAGGTGITAFTAFIADLPAKYQHRVYLFYGARRPDLLIYRPLVEKAQTSCSNLLAVFMAEQIGNTADCLPGRVNLDIVWPLIVNPMDVTYYIAGPPEMIANFTQELGRRRVPSKLIVTDAWE